jgi:hypothetical protein
MNVVLQRFALAVELTHEGCQVLHRRCSTLNAELRVRLNLRALSFGTVAPWRRSCLYSWVPCISLARSRFSVLAHADRDPQCEKSLAALP